MMHVSCWVIFNEHLLAMLVVSRYGDQRGSFISNQRLETKEVYSAACWCWLATTALQNAWRVLWAINHWISKHGIAHDHVRVPLSSNVCWVPFFCMGAYKWDAVLCRWHGCLFMGCLFLWVPIIPILRYVDTLYMDFIIHFRGLNITVVWS